MAIPTYGVVLMAVGIPLFLIFCCCCCGACISACFSEDDDDLEASRKETKPVVANRASLITNPQPVTKPKTNPSSQVSHAPLVQERKEVPEPDTNPSSLVQESKKVAEPSNAPDTKEKPTEPTVVPTTLQRLESIKLRSYEYEELAAATGGFSNFNLLGEGAFGAVYKGTFPKGEVLAIKKFKRESGDRGDEFAVEILTISRARHRHLVKLVGYCVDEANRLIVTEYVPNNSLRSHLHGKGKQPVLSWSNRMKIAIGSAKGLEYLHQGCDRKIIHRDIKADNILLDHNFEPKIADFGLATDCSDSVSHISTDPKGTFGYLAPEYAKDRKLTDKSDVFSYGVVLLELITGKKHVFLEDNDHKAHNLAVWLVSRIKKAMEREKYKDLVDPKLKEDYIDENELGRMIYCAAACVYKSASDRPNMRQIVDALQGHMSVEHIWASNDSKYLHRGAPYDPITSVREAPRFSA